MLHQSLNLSYLPNFFVALFNVFCGAHDYLLYSVNIFILEEKFNMTLVTIHLMYFQKSRVLWIIIVDHCIPELAIKLQCYKYR